MGMRYLGRLRSLGWLASLCFCIGLTVPVPGQTVTTPAEALQGADRLWRNGSHKQAVAIWRILSENGNAPASLALAQAYRQGLGVDSDPDQALALARQAASQGYAPAQLLTGALLLATEGADALGEAEQLWRAAGLAGDGLARYRLALLYWDEQYTQRDKVKAYAWMLMASAKGLDLAVDAEQVIRTSMNSSQRRQAHIMADQLRRASQLGQSSNSVALTIPAAQATQAAETDPISEPPLVETSATPMPITEQERDAIDSDPAQPAQEPTENTEPDPALPAKAEVTEDNGWQVQLASVPNQAIAQSMADRLNGPDKDLIEGYVARIVRADLGERGIYFRLRVGFYPDREAAFRACSGFEASGQQCLIVAPKRR